jgi:hypothetical protein
LIALNGQRDEAGAGFQHAALLGIEQAANIARADAEHAHQSLGAG